MTFEEVIEEVRFNMSTIGLKEESAKRVKEAREIAINAIEIVEVLNTLKVSENCILSSEDYQYLYSKLTVNKIPDFIKKRIDNGEELSFIHQFILKNIIDCDKKGIHVGEESW